MKIDEVQGAGGIPGLRSQDVARQAEGAKPSRPTGAPDQLNLSTAARSAQGSDAAQRASALRAEMQQGPQVDPQALAQKLLDEGIVP